MIFYKLEILLSWLLLLIIVIPTTAQDTYYYKQVKVVRNSNIVGQGSGGQFISFYKDICYESNIRGESVGHGMLELVRDANKDYIKYRGRTYWGEATFKFNKSLERLNVIKTDGTIYVYSKCAVPQGITTCSLIRKSKTTGGSGYYPIPPVYDGNLSQPIPNSNTSINNGANNTPTIKGRKPKLCGACNGRGWVPETKGVASFGQSGKWCDGCNKTVSANHYHATCPSCKGKGYW